MSKLDKAIEIVGSQAMLAKQLGVTPPVVFHWKKRGVPAKYCRKIQKITGDAVIASDLRPDVFGDAG
ncbi:MAG: DNA-binding transcriptional regulator YdaS (Cro superfamily) [Cycloclasticus pugetii]|jgi:DNA-binding transcriptional regulator YdaS (Cro superfamily)